MKILDIFYNQIIKEACTGRINCFLYFNMPFSTYIYETNEKYICEFLSSNELLIPTLIIKNKKLFDELLIEYVTLANNFYDNKNFPEEILDNKMYEEDKICKEKFILSTLWSNATVEDFGNPTEYLQQRISFLKNRFHNNNTDYIESLEGILNININKDNILNETPYQMEISLKNNNNEIYYFPKIKIGIYNNKAYIYAIQNKEQENNSYVKKVNRKLYKVNENFYDEYEEENMKDITPSFLVAANIALAYLSMFGVDEILIPNVLIERWNAKSMAIIRKIKHKNYTKEEIEAELMNQNRIWMNINEKFIRTFRRLEFHHDGINITSEPFLVDSYMHLSQEDYIYSNNTLLADTYNAIKEKTKPITK